MEIMTDPYPEMPGELEAALARVRAEIESAKDIPAELRSKIAERADEFISMTMSRSSAKCHGGQSGWTSWVIRNDDLNLIQTLAPTGIAIVAYTTTAVVSPAVLVVTLIFAALKLPLRSGARVRA
jgi:hypothetical protein